MSFIFSSNLCSLNDAEFKATTAVICKSRWVGGGLHIQSDGVCLDDLESRAIKCMYLGKIWGHSDTPGGKKVASFRRELLKSWVIGNGDDILEKRDR